MRRIAERQPGLLTPPARKSVPFPLLLALLALGSWLLLRVALWLTVGPAQMTAGQSAGAFARGLWFDLATLAYLLAPWLLLSAVLPNRWRGRPGRNACDGWCDAIQALARARVRDTAWQGPAVRF